jgi:hypothetical protein
MAVPLLVLTTLLARAATFVLTHPTTWLLLLGWFAISKFDMGIATKQLQSSIADLWWLVVLIVLTVICNNAIRAYFHASPGSDR